MVSTCSNPGLPPHRQSTVEGEKPAALDGSHHGGRYERPAGVLHDMDEDDSQRDILRAVRYSDRHIRRCVRVFHG